jgi:hypothetical protein
MHVEWANWKQLDSLKTPKVSLLLYDARKYKMGTAMRRSVQVILFFLSLTLSSLPNNPLESDHYDSAILFYVT